MNPYQRFVTACACLLSEGRQLPLGGIPPHGRPAPPANAPVALIFSPHPDDECIIGGLALRLLRESGIRILNIAVTLGSNRERQQPRLQELQNACRWLGFESNPPRRTAWKRSIPKHVPPTRFIGTPP